jgi:hypothetical protein
VPGPQRGDGGFGCQPKAPSAADVSRPTASQQYDNTTPRNVRRRATSQFGAFNGQPGLVVQQDGGTVAVLAFDVAGDRIKHIWVILNPEKLRPWTTG